MADVNVETRGRRHGSSPVLPLSISRGIRARSLCTTGVGGGKGKRERKGESAGEPSAGFRRIYRVRRARFQVHPLMTEPYLLVGGKGVCNFASREYPRRSSPSLPNDTFCAPDIVASFSGGKRVALLSQSRSTDLSTACLLNSSTNRKAKKMRRHAIASGRSDAF